MSLKIEIHSVGFGTCSLSGGKEAEGIVVTFPSGIVKEGFLSFKGFKQLVKLQLAVQPSAAKGSNQMPERSEAVSAVQNGEDDHE